MGSSAHRSHCFTVRLHVELPGFAVRPPPHVDHPPAANLHPMTESCLRRTPLLDGPTAGPFEQAHVSTTHPFGCRLERSATFWSGDVAGATPANAEPRALPATRAVISTGCCFTVMIHVERPPRRGRPCPERPDAVVESRLEGLTRGSTRARIETVIARRTDLDLDLDRRGSSPGSLSSSTSRSRGSVRRCE